MHTEQQTVELPANALESSTEYSIVGIDLEGSPKSRDFKG